ALVRALYDERIDGRRIGELSPIVVAAAVAGDGEAVAIVARLADELAAMAIALIRRTHVTRRDPEIVLAGAVLRNAPPLLTDRLAAAVHAVAPLASFRTLREPPVLGAALLGLDALGLDPDQLAAAASRLRSDAGRLAASA
ncbi:MAG: BadF/BadG/BcrA/BcrD ATPase family protein, partial [Candidatus Limnocylindrales bacterium]